VTYPKEYERVGNVNTESYWNIAHRRMADVTSRSVKVAARVAEILSEHPGEDVVEYGFGNLNLARLIGQERWLGVDFSAYSVEFALSEGFDAQKGRCGDTPLVHAQTVVGIEVLEHLDRGEMMEFMSRAIRYARGIFSVPQQKPRDLRFKQHMRTFGYAADFANFLRQYWANVEVEKVGVSWLLGHGWH